MLYQEAIQVACLKLTYVFLGYEKNQLDVTGIDVYSCNVNSTCFEHHYAPHQENRLYKKLRVVNACNMEKNAKCRVEFFCSNIITYSLFSHLIQTSLLPTNCTMVSFLLLHVSATKCGHILEAVVFEMYAARHNTLLLFSCTRAPQEWLQFVAKTCRRKKK